MKNQKLLFNILLVLLSGVLFFVAPVVAHIYSAILVFWLFLCVPYFYKYRFVQKLQDGFYKLSFPYTTDEAMILNVMQIVNFFIAKRFQFLNHFNLIKEKNIKKTDKIVFLDDFKTLDTNTWYTGFPWGDGNNVSHNVYIENDKLVIRMLHENHRGWWDGWVDFITTTGTIYSKKTYPVNATYEAKVDFTKVDYIVPAFWLLNIDVKDHVEEIDFEYHLSEKKVTLSQHWGNCYSWANHFSDKAHRQDSFAFKTNLSKMPHVLKFVIKKHSLKWYIDGILVKWHFIGVPVLDQHVVFGVGNLFPDEKDRKNVGKLDLKQLPAYCKCDYIKIDKN